MTKAVIFDIDGTLVDTVDMHAEAWQRAFGEFGKQVEVSAVREQIGKGGDQLMPVFFTEAEIERFGEEMEKRRGDIYKQEYMPRAKAFGQVRELFERIAEDGKRIALATSAAKEELEFYKKLANISDLVEEAASADDAEKSKPHPDIFEAAVAQLGDVKPAECIAVGDTPYDAIAAGRAGIRTIGFLSGGFSNESLVKGGCIEIYDDAADLLSRYADSAIVRG